MRNNPSSLKSGFSFESPKRERKRKEEIKETKRNQKGEDVRNELDYLLHFKLETWQGMNIYN